MNNLTLSKAQPLSELTAVEDLRMLDRYAETKPNLRQSLIKISHSNDPTLPTMLIFTDDLFEI